MFGLGALAQTIPRAWSRIREPGLSLGHRLIMLIVLALVLLSFVFGVLIALRIIFTTMRLVAP